MLNSFSTGKLEKLTIKNNKEPKFKRLTQKLGQIYGRGLLLLQPPVRLAALKKFTLGLKLKKYIVY